MEQSQFTQCPITDGSLSIISNDESAINYRIVFQKKQLNIKLSNKENWNDSNVLSGYMKNTLQAMIANEEWPIDEETLITSALLQKINREALFPRTFDEKCDWYLFKCYRNGGDEYKSIPVTSRKYLDAYCSDGEEFSRVLLALRSSELISMPTIPKPNENVAYRLTLTSKGIDKCKVLLSKVKNQSLLKFEAVEQPEIVVISLMEDRYYARIIGDSFVDMGASIVLYDKIDINTPPSRIQNIISSIRERRSAFIVFIKSESSDASNNYGTLFDVASEIYSRPNESNENTIVLALVDDSNLKSRPTMDHYYNSAFDIRIKRNRVDLQNFIYRNWKSARSLKKVDTKKFNLPIIRINESERIWLEKVYEYNTSNKFIASHNLLSTIWDVVPIDFNPSKISELLLRQPTILTLLGIYQVNPHDMLFSDFERVVFAIRDLIRSDPKLIIVTTENILNVLPDLTSIRIRRVFENLFYTGPFAEYADRAENNNLTIKIDSPEIYDRYRNFQGLEDLMEGIVKGNKGNSVVVDLPSSNVEIGAPKDVMISSRTQIRIKDADDISPLFDIGELAKDMSTLINNLKIEKEKGQMIGVFGRWGRGKTFFMKRIWEELSTIENKKGELTFVKVDFHAWKYQETPSSWAYLYEEFAKVYLDKSKSVIDIKYYSRLICLNWARREEGWGLKAISILILAGIIAIIGSTYLNVVKSFLVFFGVIISYTSLLGWSLNRYSTKAVEIINKYSRKHNYKQTLGMQADVQDELLKLLKHWIDEEEIGFKKLVLFVEDIDRCEESRIIQVIDALRILLEEEEIAKRVIIIAAIDEQILRQAVHSKYAHLKEDDKVFALNTVIRTSINDRITEYLDKLFISAVKLGDLSEEYRVDYLNELVNTNRSLDAGSNKVGIDPQSSTISSDIRNLDAANSEDLNLSFMDESNSSDRNGEEVRISGNLDDEIIGESSNKKDIFENKGDFEFEDIKRDEFEVIKEVIKNWEGATPRQIRIFYYRYLLCKNILLKRNANNELDIWRNETGVKAILQSILEYTKEKNSLMIQDDRRRLVEAVRKDGPHFSLIGGAQVKASDHIALLEVLEIVVAY